jgi:hypothetical protein
MRVNRAKWIKKDKFNADAIFMLFLLYIILPQKKFDKESVMDKDEALEIANDTLYGLGAGVWSRDVHQVQKLSRGIEAGRVWVNCYHLYPSHASFGGYKKSGIGRETHMMMLNNYRHTKNVLVSYDKNALGFF